MDTFIAGVATGSLKDQLNKIIADINVIASHHSNTAATLKECNKCMMDITQLCTSVSEEYGAPAHAALGYHVVCNVVALVLERLIKPSLMSYCTSLAKQQSLVNTSGVSRSAAVQQNREDVHEARQRRLRQDIVRPFLALIQSLHLTLTAYGEPIADDADGDSVPLLGTAAPMKAMQRSSSPEDSISSGSFSKNDRNNAGFHCSMVDAVFTQHMLQGENGMGSVSQAPLLWKSATPLNLLCNHILEVLTSDTLVAVVGTDYAQLFLELMRWEGYARQVTSAFVVSLTNRLLSLLERMHVDITRESGSAEAPSADEGCIYAQVVAKLFSLPQLTTAFPPLTAATRGLRGALDGRSLVRRLSHFVVQRHQSPSTDLRLEAYTIAALRRLLLRIQHDHADVVRGDSVEVVKVLCDFFFLPCTERRDVWRLEAMQFIGTQVTLCFSTVVEKVALRDLQHPSRRFAYMQAAHRLERYTAEHYEDGEIAEVAADDTSIAPKRKRVDGGSGGTSGADGPFNRVNPQDPLQLLLGDDADNGASSEQQSRRESEASPTHLPLRLLILLHQTVLPTMLRIFTQSRHEYSFTSRRELFSFPCSSLQEVFDFGSVVFFLSCATYASYSAAMKGRRGQLEEAGHLAYGVETRASHKRGRDQEETDAFPFPSRSLFLAAVEKDWQTVLRGHPAQLLIESLRDQFFLPPPARREEGDPSVHEALGGSGKGMAARVLEMVLPTAAPLTFLMDTTQMRHNSTAVQDAVKDSALYLLQLIGQPAVPLHMDFFHCDYIAQMLLQPLCGAFSARLEPLLMAAMRAVAPRCSPRIQGEVFAWVAQKSIPPQLSASPGGPLHLNRAEGEAPAVGLAPSHATGVLSAPSETSYEVLAALLLSTLHQRSSSTGDEEREHCTCGCGAAEKYLLTKTDQGNDGGDRPSGDVSPLSARYAGLQAISWSAHSDVVRRHAKAYIETCEQELHRASGVASGGPAPNSGGSAPDSDQAERGNHAWASGNADEVSKDGDDTMVGFALGWLKPYTPLLTPHLASLMACFFTQRNVLLLSRLLHASNERSAILEGTGVHVHAGGSTATNFHPIANADLTSRGDEQAQRRGSVLSFLCCTASHGCSFYPVLSAAAAPTAQGKNSAYAGGGGALDWSRGQHATSAARGDAFFPAARVSSLSLECQHSFLSFLHWSDVYAASLLAMCCAGECHHRTHPESMNSGDVAGTQLTNIQGPLRPLLISFARRQCVAVDAASEAPDTFLPPLFSSVAAPYWLLSTEGQNGYRESGTGGTASAAQESKEQLRELVHGFQRVEESPESFRAAVARSAQDAFELLIARIKMSKCGGDLGETRGDGGSAERGLQANRDGASRGDASRKLNHANMEQVIHRHQRARLQLTIQCVQLLHVLLRWLRLGLWQVPEHYGVAGCKGDPMGRLSGRPAKGLGSLLREREQQDARVFATSPQLFSSADPLSSLELFNWSGYGRVYFCCLWLCHHLSTELQEVEELGDVVTSMPLWTSLLVLCTDVGVTLAGESFSCGDARQKPLRLLDGILRLVVNRALPRLTKWRPSNPTSSEVANAVSSAVALSAKLIRVLTALVDVTGARAVTADAFLPPHEIQRSLRSVLVDQKLLLTDESLPSGAAESGDEDLYLPSTHPLLRPHPFPLPCLGCLPAVARTFISLCLGQAVSERRNVSTWRSGARDMCVLLQICFERYRHQLGSSVDGMMCATVTEAAVPLWIAECLQRRVEVPTRNDVAAVTTMFASLWKGIGNQLETWATLLVDPRHAGSMPVLTPQMQCALLQTCFVVLPCCALTTAETLGRFSFEYLEEQTPFTVRRQIAAQVGTLFRVFSSRSEVVLRTLLSRSREGMCSASSLWCATSLLALAEAACAAPQLQEPVIYTLLECWATRGFSFQHLVLQCLDRMARDEGSADREAPLGSPEERRASCRAAPHVRLCRRHLRPILFAWICVYRHPLAALPVVCFGYDTVEDLARDEMGMLVCFALLRRGTGTGEEHRDGAVLLDYLAGVVGSDQTETAAESAEEKEFQMLELLLWYFPDVLSQLLVLTGGSLTAAEKEVDEGLRLLEERGTATGAGNLQESSDDRRRNSLRGGWGRPAHQRWYASTGNAMCDGGAVQHDAESALYWLETLFNSSGTANMVQAIKTMSGASGVASPWSSRENAQGSNAYGSLLVANILEAMCQCESPKCTPFDVLICAAVEETLASLVLLYQEECTGAPHGSGDVLRSAVTFLAKRVSPLAVWAAEEQSALQGSAPTARCTGTQEDRLFVNLWTLLLPLHTPANSGDAAPRASREGTGALMFWKNHEDVLFSISGGDFAVRLLHTAYAGLGKGALPPYCAPRAPSATTSARLLQMMCTTWWSRSVLVQPHVLRGVLRCLVHALDAQSVPGGRGVPGEEGSILQMICDALLHVWSVALSTVPERPRTAASSDFRPLSRKDRESLRSHRQARHRLVGENEVWVALALLQGGAYSSVVASTWRALCRADPELLALDWQHLGRWTETALVTTNRGTDPHSGERSEEADAQRANVVNQFSYLVASSSSSTSSREGSDENEEEISPGEKGVKRTRKSASTRHVSSAKELDAETLIIDVDGSDEHEGKELEEEASGAAPSLPPPHRRVSERASSIAERAVNLPNLDAVPSPPWTLIQYCTHRAVVLSPFAQPSPQRRRLRGLCYLLRRLCGESGDKTEAARKGTAETDAEAMDLSASSMMWGSAAAHETLSLIAELIDSCRRHLVLALCIASCLRDATPQQSGYLSREKGNSTEKSLLRGEKFARCLERAVFGALKSIFSLSLPPGSPWRVRRGWDGPLRDGISGAALDVFRGLALCAMYAGEGPRVQLLLGSMMAPLLCEANKMASAGNDGARSAGEVHTANNNQVDKNLSAAETLCSLFSSGYRKVQEHLLRNSVHSNTTVAALSSAALQQWTVTMACCGLGGASLSFGASEPLPQRQIFSNVSQLQLPSSELVPSGRVTARNGAKLSIDELRRPGGKGPKPKTVSVAPKRGRGRVSSRAAQEELDTEKEEEDLIPTQRLPSSGNSPILCTYSQDVEETGASGRSFISLTQADTRCVPWSVSVLDEGIAKLVQCPGQSVPEGAAKWMTLLPYCRCSMSWKKVAFISQWSATSGELPDVLDDLVWDAVSLPVAAADGAAFMASSAQEGTFLARFVGGLIQSYGLAKRSEMLSCVIPLLRYEGYHLSQLDGSADGERDGSGLAAVLLLPILLHIFCGKESENQRDLRRAWSCRLESQVLRRAQCFPVSSRLLLCCFYQCHVVLMKSLAVGGLRGANLDKDVQQERHRELYADGEGEGESAFAVSSLPASVGAVPFVSQMKQCYWVEDISAGRLAEAAIQVQEPHLALVFSQLSGEGALGPGTGAMSLSSATGATTMSAVLLQAASSVTMNREFLAAAPYSVLFPSVRKEDYPEASRTATSAVTGPAGTAARAEKSRQQMRELHGKIFAIAGDAFAVYGAAQQSLELDDVASSSLRAFPKYAEPDTGCMSAASTQQEIRTLLSMRDGLVTHESRSLFMDRGSRFGGGAVRAMSMEALEKDGGGIAGNGGDGGGTGCGEAGYALADTLRQLEEEESVLLERNRRRSGGGPLIMANGANDECEELNLTAVENPFTLRLRRAALLLRSGLVQSAVDVLLSIQTAMTGTVGTPLSVPLEISGRPSGRLPPPEAPTSSAQLWTPLHDAALKSVLAESAWRCGQWWDSGESALQTGSDAFWRARQIKQRLGDAKLYNSTSAPSFHECVLQCLSHLKNVKQQEDHGGSRTACGDGNQSASEGATRELLAPAVAALRRAVKPSAWVSVVVGAQCLRDLALAARQLPASEDVPGAPLPLGTDYGLWSLLDDVRDSVAQVSGHLPRWQELVLHSGTQALAEGQPLLAHAWLTNLQRAMMRQEKEKCPGRESDDLLRAPLVLLHAQVLYALGRKGEALAALQPTSRYRSGTQPWWSMPSSAPTIPHVVYQAIEWQLDQHLAPPSQLVRDPFLTWASKADTSGQCSFLLAQLCHRLAKDISSRFRSFEHQKMLDDLESSKKMQRTLEEQIKAAKAPPTTPSAGSASSRGGRPNAAAPTEVLNVDQIHVLERRLREVKVEVGRVQGEIASEESNYALYRRSAINAYARFLQVSPATQRSAVAAAQPLVGPPSATLGSMSRSSCEEDAVQAVFGLVELWLHAMDNEPDNREILEGVLKRATQKTPTHRFLPLIAQLTSQLGGHRDGDRLHQLVLRIAADYPLKCVWHLLALRHGHAFGKTQEVNALHYVDEAKVNAARRILHELQQSSPKEEVRRLAWDAEKLSSAYMELAWYNLRNSSTDRPHSIPSDYQILAVTPSLSIPPPTECLFSPALEEAEAVVAAQLVPRIVSYRNSYTTPGGINVPKVLHCLLSDGRTVRQLLKSNDDLRQDALIEQVFDLSNQLFAGHAATRPLGMKTFRIVPLAPTTGVIEWVEQTIPLGEYISGRYKRGKGCCGAHERYFPGEYDTYECRKLLDAARGAPARVDALLSIYGKFTPTLHYFFLEHYGTPQEWVERQQVYTRSVAVSSMMGYIVGLGDRHVNNILLHKATAEVVHIDLGIAFEQNKLLPVPELVPFRMTRNVVDGLGLRGTEGALKPCCEAAMRVLRSKKDLLLLVLQAIMHDPLARWAVGPPIAAATPQGQGEEDHRRQAAVTHGRTSFTDAQRTLARIEAKLRGYEGGDVLSVRTQVSKLIQEAQQVEKLAPMFPGWSQWV